MATAVLAADTADAAMMDYEAYPATDRSWTMDVQPEVDEAIEVDMEPDALAEYEYEMSDGYNDAEADADAIDIELYDAAAEAVAVGSPLDIDVLPAAASEESAYVEFAFPLTTPTLDVSNNFFDPSVAAPVLQHSTSYHDILHASHTPLPDVVIPDTTIEHPHNPEVENIASHDMESAIPEPQDVVSHSEEVGPEASGSAATVALALKGTSHGEASEASETKPVVPSASELFEPSEEPREENTTDTHADAEAPTAELEEDPYTYEPDPVAGDEYPEDALPSVLLSLGASEPLFYAFSCPESDTATLPLVLVEHSALFYEPVVQLFEVFRSHQAIAALPNAFDGDMTIEAYDIDLTISEDNIYAREVTLQDLALLHEGCGLSGPLRLRLYFTVSRFITRYQQLRDHVARLTVTDEPTQAGKPTGQAGEVATLGLPEGDATADVQAEESALLPEHDTTEPEYEEAPTYPDEGTADRYDEEGNEVVEEDGTHAHEITEYHLVSGPDATALEDEDDYPDVLAEPNDDGTADPSELDADLVHHEGVIAGEREEGEEGEDAGDYGQAANEPTEYEDVESYHADDEERAEEGVEFDADAQGLGEVEPDLGISAAEQEQDTAGDLSLFVPGQTETSDEVRGVEALPEAHDGADHNVSAGLFAPDESLRNTGVIDLQTAVHPDDRLADLITEGFETSNADDAFDDEFDADSAIETALFDEPAALPDDRSSVTLEDEELVDPSTTEENPRVEQRSRSNTLSSGVAKRGIDEVEVEDGDGRETAEGSPGSKRARAT